MPNRETIIAELKALGRGQLENFNMCEDERMANAGALPVKGYSPDTGYCHGVCLDWIRRVLQGGRQRFGPNPQRNAEEGYDYHTRLQEQAKRQGYAWASFNAISDKNVEIANALQESNKAEYDQAYDTYVKVKKLLAEVNSQLVDDYNDHADLGEAHVVMISYGESLRRIFQLQTAPTTLSVGQIGKLYPKVEEKYKALKAPVKAKVQRADVDQASFTHFTNLMDKKFETKKKKFGGIALLNSTPTKQYGSLSAAIGTVTNPPPTDFSNSRAMIVGFGMQNHDDDSGHGIAVYWHPKNFFILLDPNYGMFVYEQLAGSKSVSSALSYLFGTAYPAQPGTIVTNALSYEIYANRDD